MMRAALSALARLSIRCRQRGALWEADGFDRDILWRAKRNALHRALSDYGLTEDEATRILGLLATSEARGCELALLGRLTGLDAGVLDRAVPLMGLQNFITVEDRGSQRCSGPVLWVAVTEHGLRYAREESTEASAAQAAASPTARGVGA